jgi:hypothetical protein
LEQSIRNFATETVCERRKNDVLDYHSDSSRHHGHQGNPQRAQASGIPLVDGRRLGEDLSPPWKRQKVVVIFYELFKNENQRRLFA